MASTTAHHLVGFLRGNRKLMFLPFKTQTKFVILLTVNHTILLNVYSSENLVLDQLIIPKLIFFFILITNLVYTVLILYGEILSWSLKVLKKVNQQPLNAYLEGMLDNRQDTSCFPLSSSGWLSLLCCYLNLNSWVDFGEDSSWHLRQLNCLQFLLVYLLMVMVQKCL